MANHNPFGPDCPRGYTRFVPTREAMLDLITGRQPRMDFVYNPISSHFGLDYGYYGMLSDDDDDDDDDEDNGYNYGDTSHHNRYCGFVPNFLNRGLSKSQNTLTFRTCVTPEEAAKNASKLIDEEEKLKKKAEKKKKKKLRQRERRQLEKIEKENANKGSGQQVDSASGKCEPAQESDKKNKKNISPPPDPGPPGTLAITESGDMSDEEEDDDDDDKESVADEPEELDMNSWFVTNAAAIAKRKLEQKPKPDRKDKKSENSKKHESDEKKTMEHHIKSDEAASEENVNNPVTKSTELAVIGNTYAQTGDLNKAVNFFTEAIKYNPQEFKLFGNRSFCYEKMQQYEKALIDADIALSLKPTWIKGLYRKGKALVGLKRYYEAGLTFKEVLKLDSSCTDAAQELMRVQIMQLMDIGYTREESSNALIIYGTVEKALDALSVLHGNMTTTHLPNQVHIKQEMPQPPKVPLRMVPQNQPKVNTAAVPPSLELFPVWVGDLVPAISASKIYELFSTIGPVHGVKLLSASRCAFVNYIKKEDCEKAIKEINGWVMAGTTLVVRYPDRIHTHLGVSKTAATDSGRTEKLPDECHFWRTTGCIKDNRCTYKHIPEHMGIDGAKVKH